MNVLIAPDSFKGSLSSVEVARALAEGWRRARPADTITLSPLADGGEGTLAAIEAAGGWDRRQAVARDPLGRPIQAAWLLSADGETAVVEMAAASGLSRLTPGELDAVGATSAGTGDLLRAAIDAGPKRIVVGIGGSATTDGGRGIVEALGGRVTERGGSAEVGDDLVVDLERLEPRLAAIDLRVACDVDNPLLGPRGAAATYGPQKGASPEEVAMLDQRNGRWAAALEAATGAGEQDTPGAGAAGGVGFALLCLRDRFAAFGLEPGVELVMSATGFDAALERADLVITGEGRLDAQTAFGKTALGVARRARAAGVACIAIGGGVEPEGIEALAPLGTVVVPVVERPTSLEAAMAAGSAPVERCGERLARLVGLVGSGVVR